jgi:hypothetical protein
MNHSAGMGFDLRISQNVLCETPSFIDIRNFRGYADQARGSVLLRESELRAIKFTSFPNVSHFFLATKWQHFHEIQQQHEETFSFINQ